MDPIEEGGAIFREVANSVDWSVTNSLEQARDVLSILLDRTEGLVIVDFLDSRNWDRIDGLETDIPQGFLYLHYRDHRNIQEDATNKELRQMVFPADLYSLFINFKELRILRFEEYAIFLVRGYSLKDKEIKRVIGAESEEFNIFDNNDNFSTRAIRKKGGHIESFTCLTSPIYSMVIVPKGLGIHNLDSKRFLYRYNFLEALNKLNQIKTEFEKGELNDDEVCEKSNSVRRTFEFVLKVELSYWSRYTTIKQHYAQLLLGDLIKLLKPFHEEVFKGILGMIAQYSNELSHDSGMPVRIESAKLNCSFAILYTRYINSSIWLEPHPKVPC